MLLGMPDTDMLNIIKVNIDSIDAKDATDSELCANMQTDHKSKPKQETDRMVRCYTNIDSILKERNKNTKPTVLMKSNKMADT